MHATRRTPPHTRALTIVPGLVAGVLLCGGAQALAPGDPLRINEVHYDPAESPQASHEFVELWNAGPDTLYLDGAVITDEGNAGGIEATFQFPGSPGGTTLPVPPGTYVLLVPDATGSPYAGIDWEFFAGGTDSDDPTVPNLTRTSGVANDLVLANGGDGLTLSSGASNGNVIPCAEIVDGVSWETGGSGDVTATSATVCSDPAPHPGTPAGSTMSLQRCPDGADTDSSAVDFRVSPRTPGLPNACPQPPQVVTHTRTPCVPNSTAPVTVQAVVIDPDGDTASVSLFFQNPVTLGVDSLAMTPAGATWDAVLPAFPDQSAVRYWFALADSVGEMALDPAGAPAATHAYRVGMQDIAAIQSSTLADSCASSTWVGEPVNVSGIVTHEAVEFDSTYFYIQQDTLAWSGVRVAVPDGSFIPEMGDRVTVSGIVAEAHCQTEVVLFPGCANVDTTGQAVIPRALATLTDVELEENEGMLVTIAGPFSIQTSFMGEIFEGTLNLEFEVGTPPASIWVGRDTAEPDLVSYSTIPFPGTVLDGLTGVVAWRPPQNGDLTTPLRLEPRRDNDVDVNYTGVDDDTDTPRAVRLLPVRPNPFNPRAEIAFTLVSAAPAELSIHDARGACVRRLVDWARPTPGTHRVVWDGRDDAGRALASGVYLVRLRTGETLRHRKIHLVR